MKNPANAPHEKAIMLTMKLILQAASTTDTPTKMPHRTRSTATPFGSAAVPLTR